jgi:hypothetical protein
VQALSNITWACARLSICPSDLLTAIALECAPRLALFESQSVAIICWSFAKLEHKPPDSFLEAADKHIQCNFQQYSSQGIALVLFGLAMQRRCSPVLLEFVSQEIEACGMQFSPMGLVLVITTFAVTGFKRQRAVKIIMQQVLTHLPKFEKQPQLLCSILWAVARLQPLEGRCAFPFVVRRHHTMHTLGIEFSSRASARSQAAYSGLQVWPQSLGTKFYSGGTNMERD